MIRFMFIYFVIKRVNKLSQITKYVRRKNSTMLLTCFHFSICIFFFFDNLLRKQTTR